jgi:NAD(P)-dependent dehydrogenase (short-subunit alcohol dehydrogenase family)
LRYLVTGGSSGIGAATARLLAGLGHSVFLIGRDYGRLRAVHDSLPGGGHGWKSVDLTMSLSDRTDIVVAEIASSFGSLNGLVHAAGIHSLSPLRYQTHETADSLMQANYHTAWHMAKAMRQPQVRADGPLAIVFVASVAGIVGQPATSAYAASKAALIALARSLAVELAASRVRVNCVAPGVVRTPMQRRLEQAMAPGQFGRIVEEHPLGIGDPDDVAEAIEYLLRQKWTTGTILTVDGGYTAR